MDAWLSKLEDSPPGWASCTGIIGARCPTMTRSWPCRPASSMTPLSLPARPRRSSASATPMSCATSPIVPPPLWMAFGVVVSWAATRAAYERWSARADADLTVYLDAAFRGLAAGFSDDVIADEPRANL